MGRGLSADFEFPGVWAEGLEPVRGRDSDLEEGVVRWLVLVPAVLVLSIIWTSSSESRVRSMALLSTLSFAAFSASFFASAPNAQAVLSRFLSSAAFKNPSKINGKSRKREKES